MLSCLCDTKPPFLHERACDTLNLSPQGHIAGRLSSGTLYRNLRASRNSPFVMLKLKLVVVIAGFVDAMYLNTKSLLLLHHISLFLVSNITYL